jgi:hypothetical protein
MMSRSVKVFISLLCFLCPALCFGQAAGNNSSRQKHTDFSGTWALDKAESKLNPSDPSSKADMTLVITQDEPEIKVSRTVAMGTEERQREFVYYTDGREESIPSLSESVAYDCKSKWDKSKLLSKCKIRMTRALNKQAIVLKEEFTERWELSRDKKVLTQRISFAPKLNNPPNVFRNLPPGVRESAQRERTVRTMLEQSYEIVKVFRRVP